MLKESLLKVLGEQIVAEYYSAYLYLAMSAWADRAGYQGIANWLFVQAQEEMAHGTHIYEHVLERGEAPTLSEIQAPKQEFDSMQAMFEMVLSHEQWVTERINNIATIAMKEGDHATYNFIMWYVDEQVEEEASADQILSKVKAVSDHPGLMYNLDAELATRVFVNPFPAAAT